VDIVLTSNDAGASAALADSTGDTTATGGCTASVVGACSAMGSVAAAGCAGVLVGSVALVVDDSVVEGPGVEVDVDSSDVPCVEVCAPPELLTDVLGLSSDPDSVSAAGAESDDPEGFVDVVEASPVGSAFASESEPDEAPSVLSADATPWPVATARPRKVATANPLARRLLLDEATLLLLGPPERDPHHDVKIDRGES
jgi:hypothetical protein